MALSVNSSRQPSGAINTITAFPFTMCGWFRVPTSNQSISLMDLVNPSANVTYDLYHPAQSTKVVGARVYSGGYGRALSSAAMIPGQWQHVTGVFASSTLRLVYLDGGHVGSNTTNLSFVAPTELTLGNAGSPSVDVAEVAIFAAALSVDEVAELAAGFAPTLSSARGSLLYYSDLRQSLDRPCIGPALTASSVSVVAHPPIRHRRQASVNLQTRVQRLPFRPQAQQWFGSPAEAGGMHATGIAAPANPQVNSQPAAEVLT